MGRRLRSMPTSVSSHAVRGIENSKLHWKVSFGNLLSVQFVYYTIDPKGVSLLAYMEMVWYARHMQDELLTARQASKLLHVAERTAQVRAQRASLAGDRIVTKIGASWAAPEWWWRQLFPGPVQIGRPAEKPTSHAVDRDDS